MNTSAAFDDTIH